MKANQPLGRNCSGQFQFTFSQQWGLSSGEQLKAMGGACSIFG